ncbi:Anthranilate synthase component 1 [Sporomusa ovata DSM 2662]|uniref:Anthranilate synthase component 1 n=1 Tax=Sporomusa ovata TaxID=2378 RepID=A0A0U1L3M9_9FIRM|nr:anthranilate synthase component I [Sporomusa ovata]EQB25728.1 anthranilate synthase component 1 [Sporomusa ovata DSM 2662]CQR74288.1 Anthranilate synthase, aminase component [Sporomusa ovata]
MKAFPEKEEFCRLAATYSVMPVSVELPTDMETPVSLYYKLVGDEPGFILESAQTGKNFGRYSFIGTRPLATFTAYSNRAELSFGDCIFKEQGQPHRLLADFLQQFSMPEMPELPSFAGGAVGYAAYESVASWERVCGLTIPADLPLIELLVCKYIIVMDHLTHCTQLINLIHLTPEVQDTAAEYEQALQELEELVAKLSQPVVLPDDQSAQGSQSNVNNPVELNGEEDEALRKQQYINMVEQAKEYIAAGDVFQVVLSRPFHYKLTQHPFALYRRLRQANPSPYMFYINFGAKQLVGASPERLVKLEDGKVLTCPIAGTRRRGATPAEDEALAAELLADTKECAEHAMLVDLGRNDIGRVSLPGTVTIDRMMEVEKYSHVMHIVSEVSGQVDPKFSAVDVLAACFPAGTVSGAPKVRAMEIIYELEGDSRGPYAGAVGYFDFRGNMDTCITIRTLIIDGQQVTVRTGAGIVADSVPEMEYKEIMHKGRVLMQLIEEAE